MTNWKEIDQIEQWQEALQASENHPVVILKHSTTCPVSANALDEFERYLGSTPNENAEYLLVKVIESRPVSNQIADDLGVKHASPQIIMLENREAVWNTSHWSVTAAHMKAVLE